LNIYLPSYVKVGTNVFYVNGMVEVSDGVIVVERNGDIVPTDGATFD
jgi:hypothetical protein